MPTKRFEPVRKNAMKKYVNHFMNPVGREENNHTNPSASFSETHQFIAFHGIFIVTRNIVEVHEHSLVQHL
jgi:hypothetical protein